MRFRLWGQNLDGWHISWVTIPEHVGRCELLDRCLRHVGVETEEGICSDGQCLHLLKPAGQHEARVFHLNPPHLGLQEELEINAFGLRGGGEKSSRDSRSVFVVLLTKAQAEKDIFRIFLHLVQNL